VVKEISEARSVKGFEENTINRNDIKDERGKQHLLRSFVVGKNNMAALSYLFHPEIKFMVILQRTEV